MRKSETGVLLPTIRTHRSSLTQKARMKSVFIERVKQDIKQQTTYDIMNSSQIGEEQRKLKQLLRQFNDKSHMILADFIAEPSKLAEPIPPPVLTRQHIKVREQEAVNMNKIMLQCQAQLKNLESRCDNLKYTTREEMVKQIQVTKHEIEKYRVQNKDLGRGVTVNGLNICRGERYDLVKELQSQKLLLEMKREQMVHHNEQLLKEIEAVKEKTVEAQKQTLNQQQKYQLALHHKTQLSQLEKMKEDAKDKKKQIEHFKIKNEQLGGVLKQKYLTKLKQLDELTNSNKKISEELIGKQQGTDRTRKELIILQHQLSALKQGVTTIKLLESKKKA